MSISMYFVCLFQLPSISLHLVSEHSSISHKRIVTRRRLKTTPRDQAQNDFRSFERNLELAVALLRPRILLAIICGDDLPFNSAGLSSHTISYTGRLFPLPSRAENKRKKLLGYPKIRRRVLKLPSSHSAKMHVNSILSNHPNTINAMQMKHRRQLLSRSGSTSIKRSSM